MRILVTGDRHWTCTPLAERIVNRLIARYERKGQAVRRQPFPGPRTCIGRVDQRRRYAGGWRVGRSEERNAVRHRASMPWGQDRPDFVPRRLEFLRPGSNCCEIRARSGCTSMVIHRPATVRCDPRFRIVSSCWATRPVDQVPHTEPVGDFTQLCAARRQETAQQQPIPVELLDLIPPALSATLQPFEDHGELRRDRGLSLANESPRIVDQHNGRLVSTRRRGYA
jgi:hypothetical protein